MDTKVKFILTKLDTNIRVGVGNQRIKRALNGSVGLIITTVVVRVKVGLLVDFLRTLSCQTTTLLLIVA